jgi:hypothetical protein
MLDLNALERRYCRQTECRCDRCNYGSDDIQHIISTVKELERRLVHQQEWYAVRLERLRDLAKDNGLDREHCAIVANGTSESHEIPTYAQQMNILKHEVNHLRDHFITCAECLECLRESNPGRNYEWIDYEY